MTAHPGVKGLYLIVLALCSWAASGLLVEFPADPTKDLLIEHRVALFGPQWGFNVEAPLVVASPLTLCERGSGYIASGSIVVAMRGNCTFYLKALLAQQAGAVGLVVSQTPDRDWEGLIRMAEPTDSPADITIPSVFISYADFVNIQRLQFVANGTTLRAAINETGQYPDGEDGSFSGSMKFASYLLLILPSLWCVMAMLYTCRRWYQARRARVRRIDYARRIPVVTYRRPEADETGGDVRNLADSDFVRNETCSICLEDFTEGLQVKRLPCSHGFHAQCIDPWFDRSELCPVCKVSIVHNLPEKRCCSCSPCCPRQDAYANLG